jgi:hypothetical protein
MYRAVDRFLHLNLRKESFYENLERFGVRTRTGAAARFRYTDSILYSYRRHGFIFIHFGSVRFTWILINLLYE